MKLLYAPWRTKYIKKEDKQNDGCVFCSYVKNSFSDSDILYIADGFFVVMNKYPYSNGHILIVPNLHVSNIEDIDSSIWSSMSLLAQKVVPLLKEKYNANGVNIGMNIGSAAGAGIASHIHMHILPRWSGDSNFMTTIGKSRVYSEEYDVSRKSLKEIFSKL